MSTRLVEETFGVGSGAHVLVNALVDSVWQDAEAS